MKRIVILAAALWAAAGITACTAKGMGYTKASLETIESIRSTEETIQDTAGEPAGESAESAGSLGDENSSGELNSEQEPLE